MPSNAAPSSGVLRLATKGAIPSATLRRDLGQLEREAPQLVDVGVGLAGEADHHVELELCIPCARHSSAARSRCRSLVLRWMMSRIRSEAPSAAVVSVR